MEEAFSEAGICSQKLLLLKQIHFRNKDTNYNQKVF